MHALKVVLLVIAFLVVSAKVDWYDRIETRDGTVHSGTILEGSAPDADRVVFRHSGGEDEVVFPKAELKSDGKVIGIRAAMTRLSLGLYLLGMAAIFAMYCLGVTRWQILLAAQDITASWWQTFRLTFMGFFWNNFMPGMTGGDVAKAVLIARENPEKRSEAVSTVIVDRLIGLAVLAFISAIAILANFDKFRSTSLAVFIVLGGCFGIAAMVLSKRIRRFLRIDQVLKSLPGKSVLMKLDRAFYLYRSKPRALFAAIALSFVSHFFNIGSVIIFGMDLGIETSALTYFATVPLIFISASIPLFPGGWGVREAAFLFAFMAVGVPEEYKGNIVILSLLVGLSVMIWSLLGGVFLFIGKGRRDLDVDPEEVAAADLA